MIEIENLKKSIKGKRVLKGISFEVKPGEIHAYLGHNGAGKTTTFRTILGLLLPDSGRVRVLGANPVENPKVRAQIGYLPEYDLLYPNLSVWDNLKRYAMLKGFYDEKELKELLEMFELREYSRKKASTLSSGTQRRVGIARTFIGKPKVLLLDEPTRGLDPAWRFRFKSLLREYAKKENASVLFSTHILSDVDEMCDRLTVIKGGREVFNGTVSAFRKIAPANRRVIIRAREVERAVKVLNEKGYSPEIVNEYIVVQTAESAEINGLLISNGITVEEIKRREVSLEEVYALLHS
ncbi:ABC transporter ATP-binding protein [Palaeococcus ferrophilus]|uniref:ABC transporter ATP-binding protein n=1 Tax=Palaeococcus ferrophilus TaxID=83868 RepID=UPI000698C2B2|nr:ABC transporter ATP-binding protein [Palaeococcus ferrophilus]